jgi:hypothetical protein
VLLVSQLPTTYDVLTQPDVPDLGQAAAVLHADLPRNAVVLYDSPAPPGRWRQPFFAQKRYLPDGPGITNVQALGMGHSKLRGSGPVYLLLLDSQCATSVVCDMPKAQWSGRVDGYRVMKRFDRFTLYAPTDGQRRAAGAVQALGALASAYGDGYNLSNVYAEGQLLAQHGHTWRAAHVVSRRCARAANHDAVHICRRTARSYGLPLVPLPR